MKQLAFEQKKGIVIRERILFLCALLLLVLPVLFFQLGTLRPAYGLLFASVTILGTVFAFRSFDPGKRICIPGKSFLAIVILMSAWSILCGQGALLPQKGDHIFRNPLFFDLIHSPWPVTFRGAYPAKLVYYYTYWLVPAAVGKCFLPLGSGAADAAGYTALLVWTVCSLICVMLLLCSSFGKYSLRTVLAVCFLFIFFSGMDYIGCLAVKQKLWSDHLENWAVAWQYSCHTTQLGWVFNQAVPAWLGTALLLKMRKDESLYAVWISCMYAQAPFPAAGLVFLPAIFAVRDLVRCLRFNGLKGIVPLLKNIFSVPNVCFFISVFLLFSLFFASNSHVERSVFTFVLKTPTYLLGYCIFVLLEFLLLAAFLKKYNSSLLFYSTVCLLLLLPSVRLFANTGDFCMRASIPLLMCLLFFVLKFYLSDRKRRRIPLWRTACVTGIMCIGFLTPLAEFMEVFMHLRKSSPAGTFPPYRLELIRSLHDLDPSRVRDRSWRKSILNNAFAQNAQHSFFFRYLAKEPNSKQ